MFTIIPHFNTYSLLSKKRIDFLLWSKVIEMMINKEHLNESGFLKILSYYASINRGASSKVLSFFPNIIPQPKPFFDLPKSLDPHWVSGFVAGDGGFSINTKKSIDYISKLVYRKDEAILILIQKILSVG